MDCQKGASVYRRSPHITHLMFAYDCILFRDASATGENVLKNILEEYASCTGQRIHYEKSTCFFLVLMSRLIKGKKWWPSWAL